MLRQSHIPHFPAPPSSSLSRRACLSCWTATILIISWIFVGAAIYVSLHIEANTKRIKQQVLPGIQIVREIRMALEKQHLLILQEALQKTTSEIQPHAPLPSTISPLTLAHQHADNPKIREALTHFDKALQNHRMLYWKLKSQPSGIRIRRLEKSFDEVRNAVRKLESEYHLWLEAIQQEQAIGGKRRAMPVAVTGLLLWCLLIASQIYLAKATRRLCNPHLLLATLLFSTTLAYAGYHWFQADNEVRLARSERFTALNMLWQKQKSAVHSLTHSISLSTLPTTQKNNHRTPNPNIIEQEDAISMPNSTMTSVLLSNLLSNNHHNLYSELMLNETKFEESLKELTVATNESKQCATQAYATYHAYSNTIQTCITALSDTYQPLRNQTLRAVEESPIDAVCTALAVCFLTILGMQPRFSERR